MLPGYLHPPYIVNTREDIFLQKPTTSQNLQKKKKKKKNSPAKIRAYTVCNWLILNCIVKTDAKICLCMGKESIHEIAAWKS